MIRRSFRRAVRRVARRIVRGRRIRSLKRNRRIFSARGGFRF